MEVSLVEKQNWYDRDYLGKIPIKGCQVEDEEAEAFISWSPIKMWVYKKSNQIKTLIYNFSK